MPFHGNMVQFSGRLTYRALLILRHLYQENCWCYGHEIHSILGISNSTVYQNLYHMVDRGLVLSRTELFYTTHSGRPERIYYRLTPKGREFIRAAIASLQLKDPT